jgi:hypothetical protein
MGYQKTNYQNKIKELPNGGLGLGRVRVGLGKKLPKM